MTDIATVWQPLNGCGDWLLDGSQLRAGDDLETAVLISLFSDRLAATDDVIPDNTTDPRGWWGDEQGSPAIGSRLWLVSRAKLTPDLPARAKDYIVEALQWLIDDGVAAKVDVTTQASSSRLEALVTIYRTDGISRALRFGWAWQGVN